MGRLVITHSTYLEGLIPLLRVLAENDQINTITPACITKVKGRCSSLEIRVSTETIGGYKLIARKGKTAQEVFITTKLKKKELIQCILDCKIRSKR